MPPVLPGGRGKRKESGTESRSSPGWKEGRKEERKKGARGNTKEPRLGGAHSSFPQNPTLYSIPRPSSAHRQYATLLFRRDAVPDICCSLSSSPQQGICIIIISPRPSRKLELQDRSHHPHPFLDLLLLLYLKEKGKKRMERKGRIAKLAPVNHDTYRGKKQSWPRVGSSRLYICIRSLLFKRGTLRSNRFSRIESTSRNELFHGYKKKRDLLFFLFLLTFANHRVWSRRNSLSIYERSTK